MIFPKENSKSNYKQIFQMTFRQRMMPTKAMSRPGASRSPFELSSHDSDNSSHTHFKVIFIFCMH